MAFVVEFYLRLDMSLAYEKDPSGRTAMDLAERTAVRPAMLRVLSFLGRYQLASGDPVHSSATARVHLAMDCGSGERDEEVVLKFMRNRDEFKREMEARRGGVPADVVVEVLGGHAPSDHEAGAWAGLLRPERTDPGESHPYLLVMRRGGVSLHHFLASQRVAGCDVGRVRRVARSLAQKLQRLHGCGLVHFDVKPRNTLLVQGSLDDEVVLCDMDASRESGALRTQGEKVGSSAYFPPEVARLKWGLASAVEASASVDVWSYGVLLFALGAGRHLFPQDIANDELADPASKSKLLAWHTITDAELAEVFSGEADAAVAEAARHLIRWCLKGDPRERPTIGQVLAHPFLADGLSAAALSEALALQPMGMRYRFFLSHAQADAAGTAKSLHGLLKQLGVHCW